METVIFTCDGNLRMKLVGDQIHDFFGDRNEAEEEGANLNQNQKSLLIENFNRLHGTNLDEKLTPQQAQKNAEENCGSIIKFTPLQFLNQTETPGKTYADFPQIASVVDYMYSSTWSYLGKNPIDINYSVVIDAIKKNKTFDNAMNDFRLKNPAVIDIYNTPEGKKTANEALQKISFRPTLANMYDMASEDSLIKNSIVKYGEIAKIKDEVSYNVRDDNDYEIKWTLKKFPNFIEIANYMKQAITDPQIAKQITEYLKYEGKLSGNVTNSNLKKVSEKVSKVTFNVIDDQQKVQNLIAFFNEKGHQNVHGLLYKSMLDGIKKLNNTKFYEQGNKNHRTFDSEFCKHFGNFRRVGSFLENAVTTIPLKSKENPQQYLNYHLNLVYIYYESIHGKEIYSYPNDKKQIIDMNFIDYYSVKDVFIKSFSIKGIDYTKEMLNVQLQILKEGGPSVRTITRLMFVPDLQTQEYFICLLFSKTLCDLGVICSAFEDGVINDNTVNYFTTFDITCALIGSSLSLKSVSLAPYILFNKVGEKSIPGIEVYLSKPHQHSYTPITDKVIEAAKSMMFLSSQPLYKEQCEMFKNKFLEGYDPEDPVIQDLYSSGCNNYSSTTMLLEKLEVQDAAKSLQDIKERPKARAKRKQKQIIKDEQFVLQSMDSSE